MATVLFGQYKRKERNGKKGEAQGMMGAKEEGNGDERRRQMDDMGG